MILLSIVLNTVVRQPMRHIRPVRALMRSPVLCWLVLVALLCGMLGSAVGAIHSHGIAVLAAIDHGIGSDADPAHGHAHEDDETTGAAVDSAHPHHAHDHSHDKAHISPEGMTAWIPRPSAWHGTVCSQAERGPVFRLERPPRNSEVA